MSVAVVAAVVVISAAAAIVAVAVVAAATVVAATTALAMFALVTVALVIAAASPAVFTRWTVLVEAGAAGGASAAIAAGQCQRASGAEHEKSGSGQRCHA
jgi:hypothetical protein